MLRPSLRVSQRFEPTPFSGRGALIQLQAVASATAGTGRLHPIDGQASQTQRVQFAVGRQDQDLLGEACQEWRGPPWMGHRPGSVLENTS